MRREQAMPPRMPKLDGPTVVDSPTIARLEREVAEHGPAALDRFWTRVAQQGTPLVEPDEQDPGSRVVTFLWRADLATVRDVLLLVNCVTDRSVLPESLMRHLPGTDVWHRSYRLGSDWRGSYQIAPLAEPAPRPVDARGLAREQWIRLIAGAVADPLNPDTVATTRWTGAAKSVAALPDAPPQPWWRRRPGVARGRVSEHRFRSELLGNERRVWVYTPPEGGSADRPPGLLVLLDGDMWGQAIPFFDTLDNLVADGLVPPLVAIMPDAIDQPTRARELSCHAPFVDFLSTELLPWAARQWPVTDDPARTVIAGQSLGGLTASFAALHAPHRFGNVLSLSGSYWWPSGSEFDREAGWLTRQFARTPRLPVRFHLAVGLQEWILLPVNRHLRDVLEAREYPVSYTEYNGGHDYVCWRGLLADGLLDLTKSWS